MMKLLWYSLPELDATSERAAVFFPDVAVQ
jgi:hypothetical protein